MYAQARLWKNRMRDENSIISPEKPCKQYQEPV